jgi:integrase
MKVNLREKRERDESGQPRGRVRLFLDYMIQGKRHKEYLNLSYDPRNRSEKKETLQLAEKTRLRRQLEIDSGEHDFIAKFKKDADFVAYFETLCRKRDRGWKTALYHLKNFANGENVPFKHLDENWIQQFQDYVVEQVTGNTALTYMAKIKAALNQAVRDRIIHRNPFLFVKPPKRGIIRRPFLTEDELRKLAAAPCPDAEVRRAFLFACYSGLRLCDLKTLQWKDIAEDHGAPALRIIQGKTREPLLQKLSAQAVQLLGAPKNPQSPIFHLSDKDNRTWEAMKAWSDTAKIGKRISFHASRRTYATLLLSGGVDILTASRLLGHTEIRHTQIYVQLTDSMKQRAVDVLPNINFNLVEDETEKGEDEN